MWISDQFKVPGRLGPPDHQQGVGALGLRPASVQHVQAEAVHPELLGSGEVAARSGDP